MHQNIFMHHVNFDGYFLTVEIEKTCVMSYSNISLSEETSLNERCKLSHIVCFQFKIIFFRSSCTYSHRYIPTTPLSFFNLPFHSPSPSAYEFPFYFLRSHESIFWKSICAYVRLLNFPYIAKVSFWHFNDTSTVWKWIFLLYPIQRTHVVWKSQLTKTFFLHV